ncbi:hypothetical protein Tco_1482272, partial [Tanacetum coccineum]
LERKVPGLQHTLLLDLISALESLPIIGSSIIAFGLIFVTRIAKLAILHLWSSCASFGLSLV